MVYRSSPLNPNARKTGKRGPSPEAQRMEAAVRDAKARALKDGRDKGEPGSGVATFRWGRATITVRDTDVISNAVAQACKDLGIDNPFE